MTHGLRVTVALQCGSPADPHGDLGIDTSTRIAAKAQS
jgi:hypothetical protein